LKQKKINTNFKLDNFVEKEQRRTLSFAKYIKKIKPTSILTKKINTAITTTFKILFLGSE
jgi:hypothetical protein